jgi:hypothetical protein
VIDAQLYREATTRDLPGGGTATLVDLAPATHVWLLLARTRGGVTTTWHLENPAGVDQGVRLDDAGLVLTRDGVETRCPLWETALDDARSSGRVYGPLCDGALYVRNPAVGSKTTLEWTTDLLRDHVWGGEQLTDAVKGVVLASADVPTAELAGSGAAPSERHAPIAAQVAPEAEGRLLDRVELGLTPDDTDGGQLVVGAWYPLHGVPGAWVSVLEPRYIDPDVLARTASRTHPLDAVEQVAPVYSVAFDLDRFDVGYEVGTDHPRVGWSPRIPDEVRDDALPGPDGFGTIDPLVRTGLVDPAFQDGLVAVFVGGFKRDHGAFHAGDLAYANRGSHYGFVEFGTELSHLQPGLATVVVDVDGAVTMKTWSDADAADLWRVRHARQNGPPVLAPDPVTGEVLPGELVDSWARGNWSGSVTGDQRSVRSGLCLQESDGRRFLVYSYFSGATPSAMADTDAAYGCSYGILLDMNALEHTYLAIDVVEGGQLHVEHLVTGMEVLDKTKRGKTWPRFTGYADNRDFFYVTRK